MLSVAPPKMKLKSGAISKATKSGMALYHSEYPTTVDRPRFSVPTLNDVQGGQPQGNRRVAA
ncbi:hypothetical protein BC826DRAFT_1013052 [Russula brevipes]|nr:hypothetical protein BC826DRAFT_1013052 [Russula brevipes]